jgi:hypothetical protein
MKGILLLAMVLVQAQAYGAPVRVSRVLKDSTTIVALELTNQSVFCTDLGYGNVQLKVNVPDLDWLAHFDHRVVGEGLPCITGGECSDALNPGSIIDPNERLAIVPVRVILTERLWIDEEKKTCHRFLEEEIKSHIRGRNFYHHRTDDDAAPADFEKCVKTANL